MTSVLASALVTAGFDTALATRGTALIMTWTFSRVAIDDNAGGAIAPDSYRPLRA